MESLQNGTIYVANESRFNNAHYSEALTAFTAGWKEHERLSNMLEFIAPSLPVGRRFEFKKMNNAEVFYSEHDDIRATGSDFKRIEYTGSTVYEKTLNKGLTIRVDHDEAIGEDWQERYVQLLLQRLYRNEIRRALGALSTATITKEHKWSVENSHSNPDNNIRLIIMEASEQSGVRPNRILFGESAWDLRMHAYETLNSAGATRAVHLSSEELAQKLLVDEIKVIRSYYQINPTTKASIASNEIYAFYAQPAISKEDPSNLKRFITPINGNNFGVYIEEHPKFTDITVEHYSTLIVTSNLGISKLTIQ
jgi:hypothetical protein